MKAVEVIKEAGRGLSGGFRVPCEGYRDLRRFQKSLKRFQRSLRRF